MRAAVTGATGLIGSRLVSLLGSLGCRVAVLSRSPDRTAALPELPVGSLHVVPGDLADRQALEKLASGAGIFFHLAGVTHASTPSAYREANVDGTARAAQAASLAGVPFVHVSSLAARMPLLSHYAASKAGSEKAVQDVCTPGLWRILRLPAVYGPGDRAALSYFRLVQSGIAPEPLTAIPARVSLLHADDAARAILAASGAPANTVYDAGDDRADGRTWAETGRCLASVTGNRVRHVKIPGPVVATVHMMTYVYERLSGTGLSVRPGQVREIFHHDWVARGNLLSRTCMYGPCIPLEDGFTETVRWYRNRGLL